jgi:hypothetical protein
MTVAMMKDLNAPMPFTFLVVGEQASSWPRGHRIAASSKTGHLARSVSPFWRAAPLFSFHVVKDQQNG